MHRARLVFREADNVVPQVAVELLAHAVQPVCGVAGIQTRCPQGFSLGDGHLSRQVERFGLQIAAAVGFGFGPQTMVAAPAKMYAPHVAVHLAECLSAANQRREVFVGGATAAVFDHEAVVFELDTMRLEFTDPASVKGHHLSGTLGNGQRDGKTINLPRLRAKIG